jgi:predicted RNase H-like HicB family nuclease
MMNWHIRYSKDDTERATALGKNLLAVGYNFLDGCGGRAEAFMYLDEEDIARVWWFAHGINQGQTPHEALERAEAIIEGHWKAARQTEQECPEVVTTATPGRPSV